MVCTIHLASLARGANQYFPDYYQGKLRFSNHAFQPVSCLFPSFSAPFLMHIGRNMYLIKIFFGNAIQFREASFLLIQQIQNKKNMKRPLPMNELCLELAPVYSLSLLVNIIISLNSPRDFTTDLTQLILVSLRLKVFEIPAVKISREEIKRNMINRSLRNQLTH